MAVPAIQHSFASGEVSPTLYGRFDLARMHAAAATMRNMWPRYIGGAWSRAGTAFVGFSKQTGRAFPPRMIPFQFNVNQGLALEFGDQYMRVVSNGAFVTEAPIGITGVTQASPAVVTVPAPSIVSATPNNAGVTASYAPGDSVTLAGGTFTTAAVVSVTNTLLLGTALNAAGTGYVPNDGIVLAGGVQTTPATIIVLTTRVVSATVAVGGVASPNGVGVVQGTTGIGTKFFANVTVSGGTITAVNSIQTGDSYTTNPTSPSAEPVVAYANIRVTGAQLNVVMGINTFAISNPGVFTTNAAGGNFTQASTSGSGAGATFHNSLFAPNAVAVTTPGAYTVLPTNPAPQASTTGAGVGAKFNYAGTGLSNFSNGDWVAVANVGGMTPLNGQTYVIGGLTATTFQLFDVYGNPINSAGFPAYTAGGTIARIYTLTTPYAEQDLPYLKFTESADVMSFCCVNQQTLAEYPPQDLTRTSATNWAFTSIAPAPTALPPPAASGTANNSGSIDYAYVVTSVAPDGSESIASPVAAVNNAVNIAGTAGTITITWTGVSGIGSYNIYKATPSVGAPVPTGVLFGFAGSAYGAQFLDSNIVADFSQVPPTHQNPFARGQVIGVAPTAGGSAYTTITLTINTLTGAGAVLQGVLVGGALVAVIVQDAGHDYRPVDTITITGDGTLAAATLQVGALIGTYPAVVAYFQQRRGYMNTLNNPDTYYFSQPGAYTNFDFRTPTIASDAITGTPWAEQVNGIQWALNMPGGLVVFTGLSAWQLTGAGGSSLNPQALTPSTQSAQPQAYNGCSSTVPPIKIAGEIIYVQLLQSIYNAFQYQYYTNIYDITDLTLNSPHLFNGFNVIEHAWCEAPYKILWSVRSDGALLSLTYLKKQEVAGWSRHDTNGLFKSVCSIIEPPVHALYLATQRFPAGGPAYMIERMDNRLWSGVESTWCVDCGLTLAQPTPAAILTASSATGSGNVTGVTGLVGGQNYSAGTFGFVVDLNGQGPGAGAVPTLTIVGGVITAVTFAPGSQGAGYVNPALVISDPANTGSGASAIPLLLNNAVFTTSVTIFGGGNVGNVIRAGGGIAVITGVTGLGGTTIANVNILSPIVATIPNGGGVQPFPAGSWTMTPPVNTISGLNHLAGMTVTGLADGNVIPPTLVSAAGTIALPAVVNPNVTGYTAVTVGLGFQAQLQSVYLDSGEPTVQGQRKKVAAVTARLEASRAVKMGSNQPDGAAQNPPQLAPLWQNLDNVPDTAQGLPTVPYNALAIPLRTGDIRIPVQGGFTKGGQVALQQDNPLPMQVSALIPEFMPGDTPQLQAPKRETANRGAGRVAA